METSLCKIYANSNYLAFVDGSYFVFYRYNALMRYYSYKTEKINKTNIFNNPEILEKYKKICLETLQKIAKHIATTDKNYKKGDVIQIIVSKDCPQKNIWRNKYYDKYKHGRTCDDQDNIKDAMKIFYNLLDEYNYNIYNNLHIDNNTSVGVNMTTENKVKMKTKLNYLNTIPVLKCDNLEADDCIALSIQAIIYGLYSIHNNEFNNFKNLKKIYIIASDKDYLQLCYNGTELHDLKFTNLLNKYVKIDREKIPQVSLYYLLEKIINGDKCDNILPVLKKQLNTTQFNKFYEQFLITRPANAELTPTAANVLTSQDLNNVCELLLDGQSSVSKEQKDKLYEKVSLNNVLINFTEIPCEYIGRFYEGNFGSC